MEDDTTTSLNELIDFEDDSMDVAVRVNLSKKDFIRMQKILRSYFKKLEYNAERKARLTRENRADQLRLKLEQCEKELQQTHIQPNYKKTRKRDDLRTLIKSLEE